MPTIDLPHGKLRYRAAGPEDSERPPVVFIHGFLVSNTLWSKTADALAEAGIRSYAPDLPLGSHSLPLDDSADQTPRGVARRVLAFIEAMGLDDVTIVGNDSGGAISQFLIDTDSSRVGRLVLTNCDAFDEFPPAPFDTIFKSFKRPGPIRALMAPMRSTKIRHSPAGYGLLVGKPLDAEQTRAWAEPCITDAGVRKDAAKFVTAVDADEEMNGVSERLSEFDGPLLLVWGNGDRFFKVELARRLAATAKDAKLVEIEGGKTFIPLDEPERLAAEIDGFVPATVAEKTAG